eukprot:CAMPEP_0175808728 /NCGR_PEP_ID=MMETSP0107_2-20121207/2411_1 /TAXON_ID=195067 ORGANISM="Goniomonas pacifica, Strain CCMP1869" /NCGR_SAMPLE_ID=MMETSP0107_2 /ASSEMBLY_ACC=CAM_ASM_000203 /LENGTH=106 /DNA_ID=CAMNT_0017120369 /DNA_START=151 /DNA_END=472 /DNA_ORIENTATION=-
MAALDARQEAESSRVELARLVTTKVFMAAEESIQGLEVAAVQAVDLVGPVATIALTPQLQEANRETAQQRGNPCCQAIVPGRSHDFVDVRPHANHGVPVVNHPPVE